MFNYITEQPMHSVTRQQSVHNISAGNFVQLLIQHVKLHATHVCSTVCNMYMSIYATSTTSKKVDTIN